MIKKIRYKIAANKRKKLYRNCEIFNTVPRPYPKGKELSIMPFTNEGRRQDGRYKMGNTKAV